MADRRNREFHQAIYAAAHNRFLLKNLQTLLDLLSLVGSTSLTYSGRLAQALKEHARIVAAIARADTEMAEREMRIHIRNGYQARRGMRSSGPRK
jgi:DNA-binding GntR family transcriptional regulator